MDAIAGSDFAIGYLLGAIAGGVIAVSLWLWMAYASWAGHSWAPIVSTVFFGIYSAFTVLTLIVDAAANEAAPGFTLTYTLVFLIGLITTILLWCPASSRHFAARLAPAPWYQPGYQHPANYPVPGHDTWPPQTPR